jgi:hypothetical protein
MVSDGLEGEGSLRERAQGLLKACGGGCTSARSYASPRPAIRNPLAMRQRPAEPRLPPSPRVHTACDREDASLATHPTPPPQPNNKP